MNFKTIFLILGLFVFAAFVASCAALSQPTEQELPTNSNKSHPPNLTSTLFDLYESWQEDPEKTVQNPKFSNLQFDGDRVKVTLVLLSNKDTNKVLTSPEFKENAEVIANYENFIDAWVKITALPAISRLPGISIVQESVGGVPNSPQ